MPETKSAFSILACFHVHLRIKAYLLPLSSVDAASAAQNAID